MIRAIEDGGKANTQRRASALSSVGFALTRDDIEILALTHEHRFLRRNQLSTLTGRHAKRLHRRLLKLESNGYLTTVRMPLQPYIYGLGRAGIEVLVEQGRATAEVLEKRLRIHELTELFLKHELMIVDIHVRLSLSSRDGDVSLVQWKEGRVLHDSVVAADDKGTNRLPVRPDAFFTLLDSRRPDGANRANYALEADRSTTTHARFQEKIRAYWAYIEQGRHQKKLGVKKFRILTVTLTDARAENLSKLATSTLPERARKYFLFVPLDRLMESSEPVGEDLCYCPRSGCERLHALIPPPNPSQHESTSA